MLKHKYNATKTIVDDIKFDSKLEANCYHLLKHCLVELQPSFELQPKFRDKHGKAVRSIRYVADFMILHKGRLIVIDAKGLETSVYKIKAKMMVYQFPCQEFYAVKSVKNLKELLETI